MNWSSDIETIFGGANTKLHESVIRRGQTLTPFRPRVAPGARQRPACLSTRASLPILNRSPFRTVPLTLKLENGGVESVGLLKLDEAAARLGCHVETLRVHIRDGRLMATRGPHGAYYLDARDVARYPRPQRGWPKPREFSERQLGQSWTLIEGTLPKAMVWRDRELDLVDELRRHPKRNRRLYRLLSVHRLRRLGLTFSQIAAEVGITSRHARRLNAASVFLSLRRELVHRDTAQARAEALAARRERRGSLGEGAPLDRRRRAWAPRRRA
jgi:AraC-like DNA-binding protein